MITAVILPVAYMILGTPSCLLGGSIGPLFGGVVGLGRICPTTMSKVANNECLITINTDEAGLIAFDDG